MKTLLIMLIVSVIMTGCGDKSGKELTCTNINDTSTCISADKSINDMDMIREASLEVVSALKNRDLLKLNDIISANGIRFSPFTYVNTDKDIVLDIKGMLDAFRDKTEINRGSSENSGYPITTTFEDYLTRYVYNAKFLTEGQVYVNTKVQRGSSKNNIYEIYNGDIIVEYYVPGKSQIYNNMDRRSLTLVFGKEDDQLKLKAVIHGERTM